MAAPNAYELRINSPELAQFYKNLRNVDKTIAKELRAEIRKTARPIVAEVQGKALSLPGGQFSDEDRQYMKKMGGAGMGLRAGLAVATEAKTRALPNGMLVRIRISGTKFAAVTGKYRKLPRYVEGYSRRQWRHPVFPDKGKRNGTWDGKWATQSPTPFLFETVMRHKEKAKRAVLDAFDKAIKQHGFR